ncbi:pyridoxamine 5'-phosphate oxidase family protein [bacterium]|nr:pyridoxamine 5'-phosphate oxidase family protein [bacterium]
MPALPEKVCQAWENREGPVVFSTVDENGIPNAIYVTCVSKYNEDTIVLANNYFEKTLKNIKSGSPGSVLFITKDWTSYQIKGRIEYHTEGPVFDDMKTWNPNEHPGHAATAVKVESVYSGETKLL